VIHAHLHRRVSGNDVSADDVPLDARGEIYPVGIAENRIIFDGVACVRGIDKTDPEVVSLSHIAVSTQPVRKDLVAAGAAGQSYAAAGKGSVSISHRNIAVNVVVGPATDKNAREAIGGGGYPRHRDSSAVKQ
jgi:hypothetical protein